MLAMLVAGCAGTANREFVRDLDPVVGRADQAYFLQKYGDPDRSSKPDNNTEIWEYNFGHHDLAELGTRTTISTSTLLRLTFKNGILSSWRATNLMR